MVLPKYSFSYLFYLMLSVLAPCSKGLVLQLSCKLTPPKLSKVAKLLFLGGLMLWEGASLSHSSKSGAPTQA